MNKLYILKFQLLLLLLFCYDMEMLYEQYSRGLAYP